LINIFLSGCDLAPTTSEYGPSTPIVEYKGGLHFGREGVSRYEIIEYGMTLESVAEKYEIPVEILAQENSIKYPYQVAIGQLIKIPVEKFHKVAVGETLETIAYIHDVNPQVLARVNGISSEEEMIPGSYLKIPPTQFVNSEAALIKPLERSRLKSEEKEYSEDERESTLFVSPSPAQIPDTNVPTSQLETEFEDKFSSLKPQLSIEPTLTPKVPQSQLKLFTPLGDKRFEWPVQGPVLSQYGKANGRFNEGINIAAPLGTPVSAAANGEVIYIGSELSGYGQLVIIKHEDDYMTAYAHNQNINVKRGQKVKKGIKIATVGTTGGVSTPQLHFSIRKGRKTIDPDKKVN
jgi:murein DD-endopeptidase MepM/ murein hydrolase activator NlpD